MMNTTYRPALVHALLASFAISAIPGHAAELQGKYAATADSTAVEVCATASNGKVPKEKLVKALNRMLDMGETPKAAKMAKDERRNMQFEVFWKELSRESQGG
jgi:hypothetical protein